MAEVSRRGLGWKMWGPVVAAIVLSWGTILADPTSPLMTDGDPILLIGKHHAGTAAPKLLAFFGLMFIGPAIGARLSRAPPRVGLVAGVGVAFVAVAGLACLAVVAGFVTGPDLGSAESFANVAGVACMTAFVLIIGFGPPAFVLGAAGGALGAALGKAGRVQPLPDVEEPMPPAAIPAPGTLNALVQQTELVRADLGEGRRRMSARQRTSVFEWVHQLEELARRSGRHPAEFGLDRDGVMRSLDDGSPAATEHVLTLITAVANVLCGAKGGYRRPPLFVDATLD